MVNRRNLLKFVGTIPFIGVVEPSSKKRKELLLTKESLDDIRAWGKDHIDERTRKEIYNTDSTVKMY